MASHNATPPHLVDRKERSTATPNRRPLILALLILSLLFVISYTGRLGNLARINGEIVEMEQRIEGARQRQAALLNEQSYVESDGFLDDVARGEMGMGQRSEAAVVVVKRPGADVAAVTHASTEATQTENAVAIPVWQQWLALFVQQRA